MSIQDSIGCKVNIVSLNAIVIPPHTTAPIFTILPERCQHSDGAISFVATDGVPPYIYSWTDSTPGNSITGKPSGSYGAVVLDLKGCIDTFWTFIPDTFPTFDAQYVISPANCFATNGSATINLTGGWPPYSLIWSDGQGQLGVTATGLDNGLYYISVTDSLGCTHTDSTEIIALFDTIEILKFPVGTLCGFSNGSVAIDMNGGTYPMDIQWLDGGTDTSKTGLSPGWYFVTVTDTFGCTASDSLEIKEIPIFVKAHPDTSVCIGSAISFSGTGTGNYVWVFDDGDSSFVQNPIHTFQDTGNYQVILQISDTNNCINSDTASIKINPIPIVTASQDASICLNQSFQLFATGAFSYSWTPANTLDNSNIFNPFATPLITTEYQVKGMDLNGCIGKDSVVIEVYPLPVADAGGPLELCKYDSVQLQASGGISYVWAPTNSLTNSLISNPMAFPVATTQYVVTVSDTNACVNSATVLVTVHNLPIVDAGKNIDTCNYSFVTLGGNPSGLTGSIYQWSSGTLLNNTTISNPIASVNNATMFFVTVTDTKGCKQTDSVLVKVFNIVLDNAALSVCIGDSVELKTSVAAFTIPVTYLWTPSTFLNNSSVANPICKPSTAIDYIVVAHDSDNCVDSANVSVVLNTSLDAAFSYELYPSCEEVYMDVKNTSQNATHYQWILAGGKSDVQTNPDIYLPYNQLSSITLIAFNEDGCTDTAYSSTQVQSFDDYFKVTVPNVFSPNGDGVNDFFEVDFKYKLQNCSNLSIFNRWGELMYESLEYSNSWTGRSFDGQEVPAGIYYYVLKVKEYEYKGSVQVVR